MFHIDFDHDKSDQGHELGGMFDLIIYGSLSIPMIPATDRMFVTFLSFLHGIIRTMISA